MRKLWQAVLELKEQECEKDIFFDVSDTSSPYGEATLKNAFSPDGGAQGSRVAVNPYYSHGAIFNSLIKPGRIPELTVFLCDLIYHHIFEIDALEGMDREEFYLRFLEEDISQGAFGFLFRVEDFTRRERRRIAYYYYRLCRTGCYEECFCGILQELYPGAWASVTENGSILAVLGMPREAVRERRVKSLRDIFLQAGRECRIFWDTPPCIIGCKETPIGRSVLL